MGSLLPQVSIIICTNRAPDTINGLFLSISRQAALDECEVILVDNGIAPSRVDMVRCQLTNLPCYSLYLNEPRPGLWYARMSAFAKAHGQWMLLLDDDNELAATALEQLLSFVAKYPGVGGISPCVAAQWESLPDTWLQRFGYCCLSYTESGPYTPNFGETVWMPPLAPLLRPPGGGMIIHKRVAEEFVMNFLHLPAEITTPEIPCEDHAIYCGVSKCHMAVAYVPSIVVNHHLMPTRTTLVALSRLNFRMVRGYGRFTPFEFLFTGNRKGWLRLAGGFVAGELQRLTILHPKAWWLVLIRVVAFLTGLAQGIALYNAAGRRGGRSL